VGSVGVKLVAAPDAPLLEVMLRGPLQSVAAVSFNAVESAAAVGFGMVGAGGVRLLLTLTCYGDSANARPWPGARLRTCLVRDCQTNAAMCGFWLETLRDDGPARAAGPGERHTPRK
jgi:hypothetical protein